MVAGFSGFKQWSSRFSLSRGLLLLLIGGLLMLGLLDMWLIGSYERDRLYRQSLMAQQLQAQVQTALEEHVTALLALSVVYQNFVEITRYDFQQYGDSITASLDGFKRLYYVDPKLTIRQVYPYTPENARLVAEPLAADKRLAPLFNQARQAHNPVTSDLVNFMGSRDSILAITPIYRGAQKEFLGYAVGELSLNKIWEPYSHADFLQHYNIEFLDATQNGFFDNGAVNLSGQAATRLPFKLANKQWTLVLVPKGPNTGLAIQRLSLWGIGVVILLLTLLLIQGSRRHRAALNDAQKQFETIFHASPDGIVMLDERLAFKLTNQPVRDWSGLDETDVGRKTFFELFTCQCPHLAKCRELSYLLCTSEQFDEALPDVLETQVRHAETGNVRTMRLSASRKPDEKGFVAVLGDISTAKELDRVKETYIATLTHDLKTPLLAQGMVLETVLRSDTVGEQQKTLLGGARQSVQDLVEMVDATLVFYQLESSHLSLQKNRLPVVPLVRDVMESLQPIAQKRGIAFELESAVELPEIWVDPVQIKRVFHNVLSNAISYSNKDSVIQVGIRREQGVLNVSVRNEGKGIQPEDLTRIFDKYYSLSRKFKQIGTGLGLYISRRIVELHGGKLWAESTLGEDATFHISLPCPQAV